MAKRLGWEYIKATTPGGMIWLSYNALITNVDYFFAWFPAALVGIVAFIVHCRGVLNDVCNAWLASHGRHNNENPPEDTATV